MLKLKIKNFKKIQFQEAEFENGNLYFIKGSNNKGKTTFGQAILTCLNALNKTYDPIKWGENETEIVCEFTGADGLNYIARYSKEKDKEEKFVLMLPNGSKEHKITEIRKIIGYNQITVDEWFRLGLTAEGRRKQAEYILELLPAESKEKINLIEEEINSKTGISYLRRQAKTKELETSQALLKKLTITEQDKKELEKLDLYQENLNKLKIELQNNEKNNNEAVLMAQKFEQLTKDKQRNSQEITEVEAEIKKLQDKLAKLKEEKEMLDKQIIVIPKQVDTTDLKQRIEKGKQIIESLKALQKTQETIKKESETAQRLALEVEALNKKIEQLREEKRQIIASANISDKIMIDTDGCWFMSDNNTPLPFNEESISYSEGGIEITKIILEKNKNLPLVVLGKAREYDPENIKKLQKLAEQYNGIILADQVIPEGDLQIEIYEETDN